MKVRWLVLVLLLVGVLLAAAGCKVSGEEAATPAPPEIPVATKVPTPAETAPTPERAPPPPELANRPQMTVQGSLENGISYGVTDTGRYFKGDPQAPLILFEFSDYQ